MVRSSLPRLRRARLCLALLVLAPATAWAQVACELSDATTGGSTAIAPAATACGQGNIAQGLQSSAFGYFSFASGFRGSAFGAGNTAGGTDSSAYGTIN